jgi:hypothetical protein
MEATAQEAPPAAAPAPEPAPGITFQEMRLCVENISTTGALLVSGEPLGAVGEAVKLDFGFLLHEVPVSLSLNCVVRSTKSDQDAAGASRYSHGVSFEDPAPNDRLMLAALVWFHMYENPRLAA